MEPQPQYVTEPVPRYYIYLEVTESIQDSGTFDYIVVHCINPGRVQTIKSVKNLDQAINALYQPAVEDIPWINKVSISFAPPCGQVLFDKNGDMRFFTELPQSMQTDLCKALQKCHSDAPDDTE